MSSTDSEVKWFMPGYLLLFVKVLKISNRTNNRTRKFLNRENAKKLLSMVRYFLSISLSVLISFTFSSILRYFLLSWCNFRSKERAYFVLSTKSFYVFLFTSHQIGVTASLVQYHVIQIFTLLAMRKNFKLSSVEWTKFCISF